MIVLVIKKAKLRIFSEVVKTLFFCQGWYRAFYGVELGFSPIRSRVLLRLSMYRHDWRLWWYFPFQSSDFDVSNPRLCREWRHQTWYHFFSVEGGKKNRIFQLTDIARPRMQFQSLYCGGVEMFPWLLLFLCIACQEIIRDVRNILCHLAQWRNCYTRLLENVEKVIPETFVCQHLQ